MATGTYPIPLYRSAVDGLVGPADYHRSNFLTSRPIPSVRYPIMPLSFRSTHMRQSYPVHSNVLRSSTGSMLHRLPPSRPLTSTVLRPTNVRWDSAINIVDFRTQPLINQRRTFPNTNLSSSRNGLVRSESLQISNVYSMKY